MLIDQYLLNSIIGEWLPIEDILNIDELSKYLNLFVKNFLIVENEIQ